MYSSFYHAFEREATGFGSCDIPAAATLEERHTRALVALTTQTMRQSTEHTCDHCGAALWYSDCPHGDCREGEVHRDDFTSEACPMCRGEAELWWCGNVDCPDDHERRHPLCRDDYFA